MSNDTLWGTKTPGSSVAVGEDELGGYTVIADVPDHIRLPQELGGTEHSVAKAYRRDCPCQGGHESVTYALSGTDIQVSECVTRGFLWWRPQD